MIGCRSCVSNQHVTSDSPGIITAGWLSYAEMLSVASVSCSLDMPCESWMDTLLHYFVSQNLASCHEVLPWDELIVIE